MDPCSLLDAILAEVLAGRMTEEEALEQYPDRADLAPLLRAARKLEGAPRPALSARARSSIERRMLARARDMAHTGRPHPSGQGMFRRPRWAPVLLALVLILGIMSTTTVVSASALPGEPLYPIKTLAEEVRLGAARPADRPALYLEFAQRRLSEVEALRQRGTINGQALQELETQTRAAVDAAASLKPAERVRFLEKAVELTDRQATVLKTILDSAPATSRDSLTSALDAASDSHRQAMTTLSGLVATGTPEAGALPVAGPATTTATPASSATAEPSATAQPGPSINPTPLAVPKQSTPAASTPPGLVKTPKPPVAPPGQVKTPEAQGNTGAPDAAPGQNKDKDNNKDKEKDSGNGKDKK